MNGEEPRFRREAEAARNYALSFRAQNEPQRRPSLADAVALACNAQADLLGRPLTEEEHGCIRVGFHAGTGYQWHLDRERTQTSGSVPTHGLPHETYVHVHHALRALRQAGERHPEDESIMAARERLGVALVGLRMWEDATDQDRATVEVSGYVDYALLFAQAREAAEAAGWRALADFDATWPRPQEDGCVASPAPAEGGLTGWRRARGASPSTTGELPEDAIRRARDAE